MEARKRKMEERRAKAGEERGKRTERMRDGMLENAHANGKGFTAKVSRGNEQNVRTSKPTYRSIDPEPAAWFLLFFLLSSKSRSGNCTSRWRSLKLQLERRTRCIGSSSTVSESRVNE